VTERETRRSGRKARGKGAARGRREGGEREARGKSSRREGGIYIYIYIYIYILSCLRAARERLEASLSLASLLLQGGERAAREAREDLLPLEARERQEKERERERRYCKKGGRREEKESEPEEESMRETEGERREGGGR